MAPCWRMQGACMLLLVVLALNTGLTSTTSTTSPTETQELSAAAHELREVVPRRLSRRLVAYARHLQELDSLGPSLQRRDLSFGQAVAQLAAQAAAYAAMRRRAAQPSVVYMPPPQVVGGTPDWRTSSKTTHSAAARVGRKGAAANSNKYRSLLNGESTSNATSVHSSNSVDSLPMDISNAPANSSGNSSSPGSATRNPWYDSHVLGAYNGGAGLLYGRLNSSASSPQSTVDDSDVIGTDVAPVHDFVPDPPPYEYPPVGRYPTVFFTAVLQGYAHPSGLGPSEQAAFSAAVNAFLAPSPDTIVSSTTVITQALAGSGLWLPCSTALLAGDANLQGFLASTLQGDPNLVFPTATWGSVRTVNIKQAMPATPSTIAYSWVVGDYGNCSTLCGGGVQTRQVVCVDSLGNEADDDSCPQPAPQQSRSCQTQPCQASLPTNFSLVLGAWGPCNSSCGFASRTRSAMCISKEGYVGSLTSCYATPEELATQLWEPCDLAPCPTYFWSYSDWICSNTAGCGGGNATREATCIQQGTKQAVNSSNCDAAQRDNSVQPCATAPCQLYYWRTRELADCLPEDESKPCGRYTQRRRFDCVNMTNGEIVPHIWCAGPKPELGDVECPSPVNCTATAGMAPPTADSNAAGNAGIPAADNSQPTVPVGDNSSPSKPDGSSSSSSVDPGSSLLKPDQQLSDPGKTPSAANQNQGFQAASTDTSGASSAAGSGGGSSNSGSSNSGSSSTTNAGGSITVGVASTPAAFANSSPPASNSLNSNAKNVSNNGDASAGAQSTPTSQPVTGFNDTSNLPAATVPAANAAGNGSSNVGSSNVGSSSSSSAGGGSGGGGMGGDSSDTNDLGPGMLLPDWLLQNPTPALQTLLDCPKGYAVSANGKCCSGPQLDSKGACCDAGIVDACGVCNGTGRAIDALGACCSGTLDAQGVCCSGTLDECGVCNGMNSCDLKADMLAGLPSAALYLIPNSNANRRLRAAVQDAVAASLSAVSGRPFEKMRLSVVLSAYSALNSAGSKEGPAAPTQADTVVVASQWGNSTSYPQQLNVVQQGTADGPGAASLNSAAAPGSDQLPAEARNAVPGSGGNMIHNSNTYISSTSTLQLGEEHPVQLDTVLPSQQEADAPDLQTSMLLANRTASNSNANGENWFQVEHAVRILSTSAAGIKQLVNGLAGSSKSGGSSTGTQAGGSITPSSSNTIAIGIVLHSGLQHPGPDTAILIMALNRLLGNPVAVPGSSSRLTVKQVVSVIRAGTCGDGVCQVNERQSWNNPDSCPADCALPFLSCPPFNTSQQPCNGMGICFNSIGSCSCATGYTGTDCSMCALNYKLVNGFCVSAMLLMPPRSCVGQGCGGNLTTSDSMLPQEIPRRSMAHGKAAVVSVLLGTMLIVIGAALVVMKLRNDRFIKDTVANDNESYANYIA